MLAWAGGSQGLGKQFNPRYLCSLLLPVQALSNRLVIPRIPHASPLPPKPLGGEQRASKEAAATVPGARRGGRRAEQGGFLVRCCVGLQACCLGSGRTQVVLE